MELSQLLDFEVIFDEPEAECPACLGHILQLRFDFAASVDEPPHCDECGVVLAA